MFIVSVEGAHSRTILGERYVLILGTANAYLRGQAPSPGVMEWWPS